MDSYLTVNHSSSCEYEVKHSVFIGYAKNVSSYDEAVGFINEIRSKHRDAKHNVYAYVLRDGQQRRYSDDGEPQGTAGMPVLDVLIKEGLTDICVVVTRYFGGILLGTGGLVRAYSHACKLAVESAEIIKMGLCAIVKVQCDYNFYTQLTSLLNDFNCIIEDTAFTDKVDVVFSIENSMFQAVCDKIKDVSNGRFIAEKTDERFSKMNF